MGTNYYAKIAPKDRDKMNLISLVANSEPKDYDYILDLATQMYGSTDTYRTEGGVIHLGKASSGWKFLWNPNQWLLPVNYYDFDKHEVIPEQKLIKYYDLTMQSIIDFINRDDVTIEDEYHEQFDPEAFIKIAFEDYSDGLDSNSARAEGYETSWDMSERQKQWIELGYSFDSIYQSDFYSDGLRFSTSVDFS